MFHFFGAYFPIMVAAAMLTFMLVLISLCLEDALRGERH